MMGNSLISLFFPKPCMKSSMNFNNLPVKGKSQVFNPLYSNRQGAKEYVR